MCVSSLASAGATLTSFLLLTGTSQFSDWGLYAHRHQSILKEFRCHCRLSPSMHVAHGQPLPAKTDSCCTPGLPGLESLNTAMVYCVHLLKVTAASFGKVASSWLCPQLRLTMVLCVSSFFQGHWSLAKPKSSLPQINCGEENSCRQHISVSRPDPGES